MKLIRKAFTVPVCLAAMLLIALAVQAKAETDRYYSYVQAYESGYRAGQTDLDAHYQSNPRAALLLSASALSDGRHYRHAFNQGYKDGYSGKPRNDRHYKLSKKERKCSKNSDLCDPHHENAFRNSSEKSKQKQDDNHSGMDDRN